LEKRAAGESVTSTAIKEVGAGAIQVAPVAANSLVTQEAEMEALRAKQLQLQRGIQTGEQNVKEQQDGIKMTIEGSQKLFNAVGKKPAAQPGANENSMIRAANRAAAFGNFV
jgi:hypothetical protein